uniref:Small ribosomal subunit protein mS40 n=1 Tax=Schistosoma mansoni TaxID=6183 RepID=A0A5K4EZA8_SCHMA
MSILSKAPLISKFFGQKHVFGIHVTPLFYHFCTNSVPNYDIQEPIKESPHTNIRKNYKGKPYKQADLATSIEYFNSDVFRNTYKGKPVWFHYRRNYKGHFPSSVTRKNCVHFGKYVSSNPCPICRDEYLVLSHRHIELLKQFINPDTLEIFPLSKTGICRHQYKILQLEVEKASDLGLIQTWLPFYLYNYHDYYDYLPKDQLNELLKINNSHLTHQNAVISSNDIASLPLDIQEILKTNQSIPHTTEFTIQLPEINIDRPKVNKRYQMEEDYKALLMRRRRSRSFILN